MSIKVKRSRAQPIGKLLEQRSGASLLIRQSRLIDQAQRHVRAHLPQEMRAHVYVGGFRQGKLTIISSQACWITWLRFEQSNLLRLLHQLPGFEGVSALVFKVRPVHPVKVPERNTRELSKDAGETLAACAQETGDPALKDALSRLASHARKR
ncbi:DUF721 domain-containing protein [Vreelandella aquamarina]|uniref:DUF721 domain-containing protein n=1 Tax=Vreelandella aquamarina TaxID=77097 RepID=UPI00384D3898